MSQDALDRYRDKRRFDRTAEPRGGETATEGRLFVVQKHAARRLHYDLRLQFGEVLKSWAVTRGPSLDPADRRLAVHVEDHPLEYGSFEGTIPKEEYGAGAVIVWDRGTWVPVGESEEGYRNGRLKFRLAGEKLRGGWMLVRLNRRGERTDNWLLIKERDVFARPGEGDAILEQAPASVLSGRLVESLNAGTAQRKKRASHRAPAPLPAKLPGARPAPLPPFLPPQLATPRATASDGPEWLHEIKFDGYRTLARIEKRAVRLLTRNGHDWSDRYGGLGAAFEALPSHQALIDGEIIVQDEHGVSSFAALQEALTHQATHRLLFYAFDLLHLDGFDLSLVPLIERKQVLAALIAPHIDATSALQLSEHVIGSGPEFFEQACRRSLEGIVSKQLDSPYQSGRTRTWCKVKCINTDDFVIVGSQVGGSRRTGSAVVGGTGERHAHLRRQGRHRVFGEDGRRSPCPARGLCPPERVSRRSQGCRYAEGHVDRTEADGGGALCDAHGGGATATGLVLGPAAGPDLAAGCAKAAGAEPLAAPPRQR